MSTTQSNISVDVANQMLANMRRTPTAVIEAMKLASTDAGCHRPIDWLNDKEFERLRQKTVEFAAVLEISRRARCAMQPRKSS